MPDGSSNQLSLQFGLNGTIDATEMWLPTDVSNRHCGSASTLRKMAAGDTMGLYAKSAQNNIDSYEFSGFMLK